MVFDASTLILLAKIEILTAVVKTTKIIIPGAVKKECLKKDSFDAQLIKAVMEGNKIKVEEISERKPIEQICKDFKIEKGEAEALWLAKKHGDVLAVDDGLTIKACKVINQRFTTAIHFLIKMVKEKKIDILMAIAKLEKLSFYGRYSKRIIDDAYKRIKEEGSGNNKS